ncbi:MAG: response regulator [Aulosira sp. ZfuVER01]|nr:response regulator [Aulosira sp. ZfuVER01]MDZ7997528.1 response regulator [Aulosira sp. DedVER01a]MDZ8055607.1 response regulator [Aulosira sp. ZfuCHP01]
MSNPKFLLEFNKILHEFSKCTQIQLNGNLNIKSSQGRHWTFYYHLGQIVWAAGGTHTYRRLRRCIAQTTPQIDINNIQLDFKELSKDYRDYQILEILYKKQVLKQEQINAIVEKTVAELLFDIVQRLNSEFLSCDRHQQVILEVPISSINAQISLKQMQDSWNNWSKAGLASISPNLAPVLRRPQELQKQVSSSVYNNVVNLINGKHTLWDLAVKMNQSVLPVTRSLLPYINQGITELVEVPDLSLPVKNNSTVPQAKASTIPLIACVDDSPQVCKMLEQIITANGLRFLAIQDPLQALPILIQNKPDLIFLDLIMPVVNGYEVCTHLRRSSLLSKTPVVILTGSDGLFDQVRSKVFGATEFLTKPVVPDQVMEMVNKHIFTKTASKVNHQSNLAISY